VIGIIPETRKKVRLGFEVFSAELKQSARKLRLISWEGDLVR
jgi:hypothetical protein